MKEPIYFKPYKLLKTPLLIAAVFFMLSCVALFIFGYVNYGEPVGSNFGNFAWPYQSSIICLSCVNYLLIAFSVLFYINQSKNKTAQTK